MISPPNNSGFKIFKPLPLWKCWSNLNHLFFCLHFSLRAIQTAAVSVIILCVYWGLSVGSANIKLFCLPMLPVSSSHVTLINTVVKPVLHNWVKSEQKQTQTSLAFFQIWWFVRLLKGSDKEFFLIKNNNNKKKDLKSESSWISSLSVVV